MKNHRSTVQEIYSAKGLVVTTGIGKNVIIANKIVRHFNAVERSLFMRVADVVGDLGMIQEDRQLYLKNGNMPENIDPDCPSNRALTRTTAPLSMLKDSVLGISSKRLGCTAAAVYGKVLFGDTPNGEWKGSKQQHGMLL